MRLILFIFTLFALGMSTAAAQIPMTGRFVAEARCPALQSIARGANPGDVSTEPGKSYDLLGRNAQAASHYLIEVPGADPARRWVAIGCGRIEPDSSLAKAGGDDHAYVLALSWHAAFCETKPRAKDCAAGGIDDRFTLHGLWPQPRGTEYCGVARDVVALDRSGRWNDLPQIDLPASIRTELERVMPGVRSQLHRHEWVKHGTCSGRSAPQYFSDAIRLVRLVNASMVADLFSHSLDRSLDTATIRRAFDRAFGEGAGSRVEIACDLVRGRRLIVELRLHIRGMIDADEPLSHLLRDAAPVAPGCRKGFVDRTGI